MSDTLNIQVVLGTNRKGRQSKHVADFVVQQMEAREGMTPQLFDVMDYPLPVDDYGTDLRDLYPEWRDAVAGGDGLILIAPEYNHGYPGVLKSFLDTLLKEYIHKPVGLVGVSAGGFGGTRVIESMVPMVRELGLAVTFTDLNFSGVRKAFDENGALTDDSYVERTDRFLQELEWMATTFRWGRENITTT